MTGIMDLIKEALIMAGAKRVAERTELECSLMESDFGDVVIILAVYNIPKSSSYLIKIVPASKAFMLLKGCEALKYVPYGLYALIHGEADISKIVHKVKRVIRLRNLWK